MGHFLQITIARKTKKFLLTRITGMGNFLQITIARKTLPFLKKNYTVSPDRKLHKSATFCKLRSQEKLDHFSRKTIISPDRKLQNRATFCKLRSQEKFYHFSKKTTKFLLIANCRIAPLSANYDRKKN